MLRMRKNDLALSFLSLDRTQLLAPNSKGTATNLTKAPIHQQHAQNQENSDRGGLREGQRSQGQRA